MKAVEILSLLGIIALLVEIFNFKKLLFPIVILGLIGTIAVSVKDWNTNIHYYNDMLNFDNYAIGFTILIVVIALFWFGLFNNYFEEKTNLTDHFALILFSIIGAVIMVSYSNMTMLFLGIEILSLPLYVLAGSKKNSLASNEAAFKYFLMGSFATGFLLFGIALIYGVTMSFDLPTIGMFVANHSGSLPKLFYVGMLMMFIGLAFKVSAVPFHFWVPDVYEGAPTAITTFMSTIVKTAGFAAFFRLFYECFSLLGTTWHDLLWVMIVITILLGNITAIYQKSVKRMLAYSSIAHAGYMLLAILAMNKISAAAILYYAAAYSIATLIAFAVFKIVSDKQQSENFDAFNGLNKKNPLLAFVLAISMLSLAGIPPMAGFFGKYYLFTTAFTSNYKWITLIAIAGSLISIAYYFRLIIASYFRNESDESEITPSNLQKYILIAATILILLLGIFPDFIIRLPLL